MKALDLSSTEYGEFYSGYIRQSGDKDLLSALESGLEHTRTFFADIPDNKMDFAYDQGKWTIKELIQHLMDSERVFTYRALRIARRDDTPLPGFDENHYVPESRANSRTKEDLVQEYVLLRRSTIHLFRSFTHDMLMQTGVASESVISVRAIGFVIVGHEAHHLKVLEERYL